MSSPLAKTTASRASRVLIDSHQKLSHGHRTKILAQMLANTVSGLAQSPHCLDIGCGDMTIAELVATAAPQSTWKCLDLYPLPSELGGNSRWQKYLEFDGNTLPFANQSVDVALFCDVLHHMPADVQMRMLSEAARVAKHVVIKDHFEYGFWSRTLLRAMDFFGNWAYGVSVPNRYFSRASFLAVTAQSGLQVDSMQVGVDLYGHLPVIRRILRQEWQFISVISRKL